MNNTKWISLIASEFKVSRTIAKEMLHAMCAVKKLKTDSKVYSTYAESCGLIRKINSIIVLYNMNAG